MSKIWNILAFESTHAAMAAQDALASLKPYVIPTPKAITAGCGMSLRMDDEQAKQAREILDTRPDIMKLAAWHRIEL